MAETRTVNVVPYISISKALRSIHSTQNFRMQQDDPHCHLFILQQQDKEMQKDRPGTMDTTVSNSSTDDDDDDDDDKSSYR